MASEPKPFKIGGHKVSPGKRKRLSLDLARLPTGDWLSLHVVVLHGALPGPALWMDAAVHGDELNGLEIIHRVLDALDPKTLSGTVVAVPIVNVFGFVQQTRYLPDRRDLNRSFPGSSRGSLASRIAHLFMREIVSRCDYGLDFHTGSNHRTNLPQVRADISDPETRRLALAFGAPLMYRAKRIKGSLRSAAGKAGVKILVYEAGEPLRFEENAIELGVQGTLRVLEMVGIAKTRTPGEAASFEAKSTRWVRAPRSGILHLSADLGKPVRKGELLGVISDPLGSRKRKFRAPATGIVMGYTNNPLVHRGDAVVHIATAPDDV